MRDLRDKYTQFFGTFTEYFIVSSGEPVTMKSNDVQIIHVVEFNSMLMITFALLNVVFSWSLFKYLQVNQTQVPIEYEFGNMYTLSL